MKWTTIRSLTVRKIMDLTGPQIKNIEKKGCPINCHPCNRTCPDCITYDWVMEQIYTHGVYDYGTECAEENYIMSSTNPTH